jgi:hypothetical protein
MHRGGEKEKNSTKKKNKRAPPHMTIRTYTPIGASTPLYVCVCVLCVCVKGVRTEGGTHVGGLAFSSCTSFISFRTLEGMTHPHSDSARLERLRGVLEPLLDRLGTRCGNRDFRPIEVVPGPTWGRYLWHLHAAGILELRADRPRIVWRLAEWTWTDPDKARARLAEYLETREWTAYEYQNAPPRPPWRHSRVSDWPINWNMAERNRLPAQSSTQMERNNAVNEAENIRRTAERQRAEAEAQGSIPCAGCQRTDKPLVDGMCPMCNAWAALDRVEGGPDADA